MATAILRPQPCHKLQFHHETLPASSFNPHPNPRSDRIRRPKGSPVRSFNISAKPNNGRVPKGERSPMVVKFQVKEMVMEQVKILKRGGEMKIQDLRSAENCPKSDFECEEKSELCSTDRFGPEPEVLKKEMKVKHFKVADGLYAGSVSFSSPPPSSLPLPALLSKNNAATTDLRRLLRLDLC